MKAFGLPRLGIYSGLIKGLFEDLGLKVIMPSRITQDMIKQGVMSSSDMLCFPYKATLGQQIWCLEQGATDLVMWDNAGLCRQKHYWQLQELALQTLGYKFTMHPINAENARDFVFKTMEIKPNDLYALAFEKYNLMLELERSAFPFEPDRQLKIGIIGELYTILEHDINFDMVAKLHRMGVNVDISIKMSDFIQHSFLHQETRLEEQKEAKALLEAEIGGHGFQSIYNTIWYGKNGFDGVIHLLPLSCMPESTVESIVDMVAQKYGIPLYRFPIDESNFEAGVMTRLETFVSMLKRKKHVSRN